jgi:hypothetical protein
LALRPRGGPGRVRGPRRRPEIERALRNKIRAYEASSAKRFRALRYESTLLDDETIESLRTLGYVR